MRVTVRPGLPTIAAEPFVRLLREEQFVMRKGGPIGEGSRRRLDAALEPILTEEGTSAESIFLDRRDGDLSLLRYVEAEEMAGVYGGFVESERGMTDVAARIGGWLFEEPERLSGRNVESDYDLLAHAWNPGRP